MSPKRYFCWSRVSNHSRRRSVFEFKGLSHFKRVTKFFEGPVAFSSTSITMIVTKAVTAMLTATMIRHQNCSLPLCT